MYDVCDVMCTKSRLAPGCPNDKRVDGLAVGERFRGTWRHSAGKMCLISDAITKVNTPPPAVTLIAHLKLNPKT